MNALKGELWSPSHQTEKVIFLITDEDEDGGRNVKKYHLEDVIAEAKRKGVRFETILLIINHADSYFADTRLKTKDGKVVTFEEIGKRMDRGESLPEVAAFDEARKEVVWQKPKKLIRHTQPPKQIILNLTVKDGRGTEILKTTPNHRMLAEREGKQIWIKAGELRKDDRLINPDGESYLFDTSSMVRGALDTYNFSFGANKTNRYNQTYLVSQDGKNWFVTHSDR